MFSKFAATLVFLLLRTAANAEDVDVSCVFMESCVLPCAFTPGDDPLIHWTKGDTPVHSYYKNQHQLQHQHENYRNRTSLSDQGINTGNASLQLHEVKVSDEGRYKCYVSTVKPDNAKEAFVNLKVYAPVSDISLQQEEERLLCRSENIYPEPNVDWTPSPEPLGKPLTNFTSSETGLLSVLSSVPLTQHPLEEYSCNISTAYSWRSATYRRNPPVNSTGSEETVISCASNSSNAPTRSLVWTFNSTQTIVRQNGSELVYSETWRQFAHVSKSGDLRLESLTEEHTGLYSCKCTTDRETFFIHTQLTVPGNQGNLSLGAILGILGGLTALIAAVVAFVLCKKKAKCGDQSTQRSTEPSCDDDQVNNQLLLQPQPKNGAPKPSEAAVGYDAKKEEVKGLDRPEETDKLESEDVSSEGDTDTET